MFQIRIHGRGGQGVVTTAELLSVAAFCDERWAQAFPSFGSERTGAPVVSFCRIDSKQIRLHEPIMEPDAVIVNDPTLLHQVPVFDGMTSDTYLLINTTRSFDELGIDDVTRTLAPGRAITVPATEFAMRHLGRPLPGAALLGGFAAQTGQISLNSVLSAIHGRFTGDVVTGNAAAATEAFEFALLQDVPGIVAEDGVVPVNAGYMTGHPGIFAGGDMVPAERTVTVAIGHGKVAAHNIDAWLRNTEYQTPVEPELASFDKLNTWYYSDAPATVRPKLDMARRTSTFDEVVGGLDESTALFEARRCMSCGNCFECDNCYGVCPDNAIIKLGPGKRYKIDLDYCKGCGLCVTECPSGSIRMEPEQT